MDPNQPHTTRSGRVWRAPVRTIPLSPAVVDFFDGLEEYWHREVATSSIADHPIPTVLQDYLEEKYAPMLQSMKKGDEVDDEKDSDSGKEERRFILLYKDTESSTPPTVEITPSPPDSPQSPYPLDKDEKMDWVEFSGMHK
jgi:hypothetical protein